MRINPERLETDHFTVGRAAGATFCHFPSLSEPGESKRGQIELKTQSKKFTRTNPSVSSAESLVLTLAPIGTPHQSARTCFSRLPRVRPGAETGRPVPKSILIGAPIPYAERPRAGFHGGRPWNPQFYCCARSSHRIHTIHTYLHGAGHDS